jgi:hypothetical protein
VTSARRITGTDPTGSSLDRTMRCIASAALPQVFQAGDSYDRDKGTAIHGFLDRVAELRKAGDANPRETALAEVDEQWRGICAGVELGKLTAQLDMSTEVAVAYDWRKDAARFLKPLEPRLYDIDPTTEIAFTIDVAGAADRRVYIGDYKGPYGWLPEPTHSMQLGLAAVAIARIHRARSAKVEYIRIRDDGTPRKFDGDLDVFALDGAAERIHNTMSAVDEMRPAIASGVVPNVTEGPWCKWCPAKRHCPAKTSQMRAILHDPPSVSLRDPLTPETAGTVYALIRKAKDAIANAESALYAYAKAEPILIGTDEDGALRFFGELRRPGNEVLDGAITHRVLTKKYGGEAANKAVTMEVTKKAITDVARAALQPGEKISKVVDSVVEEVRKLGGAKRPETCTTVEYTIDAEGETKARKRKAS